MQAHRAWRAVSADAAVYARQMRRFSRNARLLLLSTLLGAFSAGVFRVAYNLYVLELGFTAGDAGRLVTSASLAAGLAAIPAGLVALRVGAKPVILAGAVLLGVGTALQVTPFGYGYLVAGAALGGLGGALWNVVIAPLYAGSADDAGRSYLFTVAAIVFLGMSFAGNAVGGWAPRALADAMGWPVWLGFFAVLSGAALYGGLGFFSAAGAARAGGSDRSIGVRRAARPAQRDRAPPRRARRHRHWGRPHDSVSQRLFHPAIGLERGPIWTARRRRSHDAACRVGVRPDRVAASGQGDGHRGGAIGIYSVAVGDGLAAVAPGKLARVSCPAARS